MLFTSGSYLIFLAIVFLLYWPFASNRWLRVIFLLAASYYFYALWNPRFLAVLFLISTVDFLTARGIGATKKQKLARSAAGGKPANRCRRADCVQVLQFFQRLVCGPAE